MRSIERIATNQVADCGPIDKSQQSPNYTPLISPMAAENSEEVVRVPLAPRHVDGQLDCRFYENQYPEVDELVIVNVRHIADMGAYVNLLEYNNQEGMILLSELSRRRIRSINKLIRVGKQEVVMVLRVDKEKGYIDLSKRRVSPEDVGKFEDKYNKAKTVHSVLRHVAELKGVRLEELYIKIGWPLARKYPCTFDAFQLANTEAEAVLGPLELEDDVKELLMTSIRRRLTPQPVKIRAYVEVSCFTVEGIEAIREALTKGEEQTAKEAPIKITLTAPPTYVIDTATTNKELGLATQNAAITAITASIEAKGGVISVKTPPKVVSQKDEADLIAMMEKLHAENKDVEGDMGEDD